MMFKRFSLLVAMFAVACLTVTVLGNSYRTIVPSDFFLARFDSSGNQLWSRTYNYNDEDQMNCAFSTIDDRVILVGFSDCGLNVDGFRIVCVAGDGSELWSECGRSGYGIESPFCFSGRQLDDGSLLLIGMHWILCINEDGKKQWTRLVKEVEVRSVSICPDGGYVLAGSYDDSHNSLNTETDPSDGSIVKLDSSRNTIWNYSYGREYWDYFYDATVSDDGLICAVGESFPTAEELIRPDGWVVLVNQNGEIVKELVLGRTVGLKYWDVQNAPDGGFLLFGETGTRDARRESDNVFTKLAANGDSLWSRTKGGGWQNAQPVEAFGQTDYPFYDYIQAAARSEYSHMIRRQAFGDIICTPHIETGSRIDSVKLNGSYFSLASDGFFLAGTYILPKSESDSITVNGK